MRNSRIHRLKALVCRLSAGAALAAVVASSATAQTNEELNQRMDKLEAKIDALIRMQSEKSSQSSDTGKPAPSDETDKAGASSVAGTEGKLRPGLSLDLYTVPKPGECGSPCQSMAREPEGTPVASEVVPAPRTFEWGAFMDHRSMAQFSSPMPDKRIGLNWLGLIRFPDEGEHQFQLDIVVDEGSRTSECVASLAIDGQEVLTVDSTLRHINTLTEVYSEANLMREARFATEAGSVVAETGLHKFSLWGHCLGPDRDFSKVHFNLRMKGAKDRTPKAIDPALFMVSEDG